jgi:hypothetical protein
MAIYRFRVAFEEHEDIYREIDLKAGQNYEDFHRAIQEAIGFDGTKLASFFISDDLWRKGMEIASEARPVDEDDEDLPPHRRPVPVRLMNKTKIAGMIEDPHQKIIYVSDPEAKWTFMIELVRILEETPKVIYPKCTKSVGTAPKQYKVTNLPPPPEDEEEEIEELDKDKKEKVFHAEEAYDKEVDEDEDALTEGDEEEGEPADEEGAEPGFDEGVVD